MEVALGIAFGFVCVASFVVVSVIAGWPVKEPGNLDARIWLFVADRIERLSTFVPAFLAVVIIGAVMISSVYIALDVGPGLLVKVARQP